MGRNSTDLAFPTVFRSVQVSDGGTLWRLVRAAGSLELNSAYCYLLLAQDFGDTCLLAQHDGQAVGAVIGYHPPKAPDTAFVWQIAVLPRWRGRGIGQRMLAAWMALPANRQVRWLTATVAANNPASQALFRGFARQQEVACAQQPHFTADLFPEQHPPEPLFRIGPFVRRVTAPV